MNIKKLTFYFLLLASCGVRELALAFESGSKLPHSKETPYSITNITDGSKIDFHPNFSPDGKELVFASRSEISKDDKEFWNISPYYVNLWLIDSDGRNRRQLTSDKVIDCYPSFTPDGDKVLFVSNRGGQWDI